MIKDANFRCNINTFRVNNDDNLQGNLVFYYTAVVKLSWKMILLFRSPGHTIGWRIWPLCWTCGAVEELEMGNSVWWPLGPSGCWCCVCPTWLWLCPQCYGPGRLLPPRPRTSVFGRPELYRQWRQPVVVSCCKRRAWLWTQRGRRCHMLRSQFKNK